MRNGLPLLCLAGLMLFRGSSSNSRRPAPRLAPLTPDALRALVVRHGFRDVGKAIAIAQRESGRIPDAMVDTRGMSPAELKAFWGKAAQPELSVGLWQINLLANGALVPGATLDDKVNALKDPDISAQVALKLSNRGTNWAPWGG